MDCAEELFTENEISVLLDETWDDQLMETKLADNYFLNTAKKYNLLGSDIKTLFIPENDYFTTEEMQNIAEDEFTLIWNRHSVKTQVFIQGSHSVMQIRTMSNISYGLYYLDNQFYIANLHLKEYNIIHESIIIHFTKGILPDFYFLINEIEKMPLSLLASENYSLDMTTFNFEDVTIHTSFYSFTTRKLIGLMRQPIVSENQQLHIQIPKVHNQEVVNLWIQFFSNKTGISLMSWLRPQNMTIHPNINLTLNPIIYEFNPSSGTKNQQLWISGQNFVPENVRVVIGDKIAIVYFCSNTLIKCIIPDLNQDTKCTIQVANQNVFVSSAKQFKFTTHSL